MRLCIGSTGLSGTSGSLVGTEIVEVLDDGSGVTEVLDELSGLEEASLDELDASGETVLSGGVGFSLSEELSGSVEYSVVLTGSEVSGEYALSLVTLLEDALLDISEELPPLLEDVLLDELKADEALFSD